MLILSLALSFALTDSNVAAAAGGEWIEICGETGAEMVLIDPRTGEPVEPCPDCATCSDCLISRTDMPALAASAPISDAHAPMPRIIVFPATSDFAPSPEAHWPDTRGPPAADAQHAAFPIILVTTQFKGRAPEC